MKKTIKDRNWLGSCVSVLMSLPRAYEDPQEPGALGGVQPFARAHKLKTPQAPTDAISHHAHFGL